ncbi:hypothetical protein M0R45_016552 [Rubus argutus]|uniref:Uncharacterized protein n=1 Tax=Rubus argutus TaxID=59490 RepID=A0AAW1XSA1_RUBAR
MPPPPIDSKPNQSIHQAKPETPSANSRQVWTVNLKQLDLCLHNQILISPNPLDSDGRKSPTVGSPKPVNNVTIPVSPDPSVNNVSIPVSPDLVTPPIPSSLRWTSEFHTTESQLADGFTVVLVGGGDGIGDVVGLPFDWSSTGAGWPSGLVGRLDPSPSSSFTPNRVFGHHDGEISVGDEVGVLFGSPSNWSSAGGGVWPSGSVAPSSDSSSSSSSMLAPNRVFCRSRVVPVPEITIRVEDPAIVVRVDGAQGGWSRVWRAISNDVTLLMVASEIGVAFLELLVEVDVWDGAAEMMFRILFSVYVVLTLYALSRTDFVLSRWPLNDIVELIAVVANMVCMLILIFIGFQGRRRILIRPLSKTKRFNVLKVIPAGSSVGGKKAFTGL